MSAELQDEPEQIEITDTPETAEVEISVDDAPVENEAPKEEEKTFNPKTDKVEFDKPEQQQRFNEIYRQLQKSDQRNQMLTDFLEDAVKQLEEVKGFTSEIKTEKAQQQVTDAENAIMAKIRAAREADDTEAYDKAFSELVSFQSSRQAQKLFDEKVNELSKQDRIQADNEAKFVVRAMEETDADGNYLRPWLQEDNEQFPIALYQIKKIAGKYEGDPNILEKTLKELDQVMSNKEPPKPQNRAPNPMQGSNLTNHKPKGKIKMTRKEADILAKLERHSGKKIDLKKYDARRTAMYDAQNRGDR